MGFLFCSLSVNSCVFIVYVILFTFRCVYLVVVFLSCLLISYSLFLSFKYCNSVTILNLRISTSFWISIYNVFLTHNIVFQLSDYFVLLISIGLVGCGQHSFTLITYDIFKSFSFFVYWGLLPIVGTEF